MGVQEIDQAMNSQKTLHISPLRASYGALFVSILDKNGSCYKAVWLYMLHMSAY